MNSERKQPPTVRSAEMNPGPGFRIRSTIDRPREEHVEALLEFETPDISDLLNRLYALSTDIRCMTAEDNPMAGPVCTVNVFPGDNLMVHKALDIARPGDVVAIAAGASRMNAVLGDIICTKARHRGIRGFVVDGLIRDLPAIRALDYPVFARGTTPIGPLHRGPGEINYPIACGGVVIHPGDVIVGDAAGVVVVPRQIVADVVRRLTANRSANKSYLEKVHRGEFSNAWVDTLLESHGCPIEETAPSEHSPRQAEIPNGRATAGPTPA